VPEGKSSSSQNKPPVAFIYMYILYMYVCWLCVCLLACTYVFRCVQIVVMISYF
jgi:hypothetical protein